MSRKNKTIARKKQRIAKNAAAGKSNTGYHDFFCADIIQAAEKGVNFVEFAAAIGVSRAALYQWAREFPEFKNAMDIAEGRMEQYWWNMARECCQAKFNPSVWRFVMTNVFGYKEKSGDAEEEEEKPRLTLPSIKKSGPDG